MWARFLLIALSLTYSNGYRILVVFPMPSRSHSILGDGVVNALAKANHQVTYITPFPKNKPLQNIRELEISEVTKIMSVDISDIRAIMNKEKNVHNLTGFVTSMTELNLKIIKNPNVQKLLNDPKEHFDVVIIEWLFYELLAGLSAVFNCPYIWLSSADPHSKVLKLVDDVANPSFTPDAISSNYPPFTFVQRVMELAFLLGACALEYFTLNPIQSKAYEEILVPIIQKRGHKVPAFEDLIYNASLVLSNSHYSVGKPVRLPQNFIPIGGYHINRELKPLPDNLKQLLDNSKNGLIYFSMGSNLKSKLMPEELKQDLLKMFSTLKYNVLWKFEETLPGTPSNVHIVQWAPQQSILAHPNCFLFVTHGGLLSTTETIHFGKPIVAIPVFADQFNNANLAVRKGFAKKVDLSYTMADDLKLAIEEVLEDPTYAAKAKQLSMIYHDRPVTPDKELVHWVEHVIKTGGAPHLRSPALDLVWYQKMYLDLVALIFLVLIVILYICKKIIGLFKKDTKAKEKEVKGKKKRQ